jgi:type II secretory pathway predicted ATPase ExeA
MINAIWGIAREPFLRDCSTLLSQQKTVLETIRAHARQGGFSVIVGEPGVGKTVLREHIEALDKERDCAVVSCSRTLHTYQQIAWQLAAAFRLETQQKSLEADLIEAAFAEVRERKTLYVLIDEAHLLDLVVLRKLRLLFERFPKNHSLVLFGQPELLHYLSLSTNRDIKSRITYSSTLKPLCDDELERYIVQELEKVKMGINTFDEGAMELIIRSAEGNLRLCRNLCYASLIEAARETKRIVSISHVNNVLVQPHWRSHEELIRQQAGEGGRA